MENIEEQFVTYEIALAMKELGFDKPCLAFFQAAKFFSMVAQSPHHDFIESTANSDVNPISAPLWQQCIDWLKEKHGIFVLIDMGKYYDSYEGAYPFQAWCKIYKNKELINSITVRNKLDSENFIFYSYEEAREQAILKAIELCPKKKNK